MDADTREAICLSIAVECVVSMILARCAAADGRGISSGEGSRSGVRRSSPFVRNLFHPTLTLRIRAMRLEKCIGND